MSISYEEIVINNINIQLDKDREADVFFSIYDNIFLLSFSQIIIQESIRQLKTKTDLFKLDPIKKLDQNLPKYNQKSLNGPLEI